MGPLGYGEPVFLAYVMVGLAIAVVIGGTVLWIWIIRDCLANEPSGTTTKKVWMAIIVLTHMFGALAYYWARRQRRMERFGK